MTVFTAAPVVNNAANRIVLIGHGRHEEAPAAGVIPVGSLIQSDGAGGYICHNSIGGRAEKLFAKEHGLEGIGGATTPIGAFDDYASGALVFAYGAVPFDEVNCLIAPNQTVLENSFLSSNGDGTLALLSLSSGGQRLYESVADSAAVANSTVATAFDKHYSIPASTLIAGDVYKFHAQGKVTWATGTLLIQVYLGSQLIAATAAQTNANNDEFLIDGQIIFRTVGASGTMIANGILVDGVPGTATARSFLLGSTAVDTTVAQDLTVKVTWGTADVGNSVVLSQLLVDLDRGSSLSALVAARQALTTTSAAALLPCRVL